MDSSYCDRKPNLLRILESDMLFYLEPMFGLPTDFAWEQSGSMISGEAKGARLNDGGGKDSGHIRVYKWDQTDWVQVGQPSAPLEFGVAAFHK